MKGNPHKKMTFEDRLPKVLHLGRHERKVWKLFKRRNRKLFRKDMKKQIEEYSNYGKEYM